MGDILLLYDVSVIIPVFNAHQWLDDTLSSVYDQDFSGSFELSIYDDGSTDGSIERLLEWRKKFEERSIGFTLTSAENGTCRGPGYARNRAIAHSRGRFLCFLDADDVMLPERIRLQYEVSSRNTDAIVGSRFVRDPPSSTERYSRWANEISSEQLYHQVYTSHAPTLILPTWFLSRQVFNRVGKFDDVRGEDLIFFYEHLATGGRLIRVDQVLVTYRYHLGSFTFSVLESSIWDLRVREFQERVLCKWNSFTVWNAGKQGRRFYRSLTPANRKKVVAFCDVDPKKIALGRYTFEESDQRPKPVIPVVHFSASQPPYAICVKLDLTGGAFEQNLASLDIREGVDYFHFS